jgi:hypothetical protein
VPFCIISLLLALDLEVASGCGLRWNGNKFCRMKGMVPTEFAIKTKTNEHDENKFEIISEDVMEFEILLSKEPIGKGSFGNVSDSIVKFMRCITLIMSALGLNPYSYSSVPALSLLTTAL